METIVLTVEPRTDRGKGNAGRLRRQGRVPAVFYGPGKPAASVSIDAREFHFKIAGLEGSHLIQLASSQLDLHDKIAILREVQRHPVTDGLVHVDFLQVDENKPLQVAVALHFVGKAEGVTAGGQLQSAMRAITVECLPREIPEFIEIDVTHLKVHDSIHISGITLPPGVRAVFDADESVVSVTSLAAETPASEVAAAPAVAAAAPAAAPAAAAKK
ncbi:MAG: 50S ribosomal protein L25 [Deltaproteobacteria bacterium]|nr:50S ribosomal protein L25 [Deltaproteobacteria bacterium]